MCAWACPRALPTAPTILGLSAEGAGKNAHFLLSSWKGFDFILSQLVTENLASNQPATESWLGSSLKSWWAPPSSGSLTVKPSLQFLPRRNLSIHLAPHLLWMPPEWLARKSPSLGSQQGLAFRNLPGSLKTKRHFYMAHRHPQQLFPPAQQRRHKHPALRFSLIGARLHI